LCGDSFFLLKKDTRVKTKKTNDIKEQAPNVVKMNVLGVNIVESFATLKEAVDAAFKAYSEEYKNSIVYDYFGTSSFSFNGTCLRAW